MLKIDSKHVESLLLLGRTESGKTTLAEAMLY